MSDPLDLTPKLGDLAFTRPGDRGTEMEATFAGALSFMRRRYTRDLSGVDVAVWGVPFDLAVTNRPGTRFGPRGVRAASAHMAWSGPWPWDFDPYDELAVIDYGDCLFDPGRPTEIAGRIVEQATAILDSGAALLTIGGDHFITYPLLRAHAARHGKLSVIQFDAHTDTWADEGDRIDHGTMMWYAFATDWSSHRARRRSASAPTTLILSASTSSMRSRAEDGTGSGGRKGQGDRRRQSLLHHLRHRLPRSLGGTRTGTPVPGGLTSYQAQKFCAILRASTSSAWTWWRSRRLSITRRSRRWRARRSPMTCWRCMQWRGGERMQRLVQQSRKSTEVKVVWLCRRTRYSKTWGSSRASPLQQRHRLDMARPQELVDRVTDLSL